MSLLECSITFGLVRALLRNYGRQVLRLTPDGLLALRALNTHLEAAALLVVQDDGRSATVDVRPGLQAPDLDLSANRDLSRRRRGTCSWRCRRLLRCRLRRWWNVLRLLVVGHKGILVVVERQAADLIVHGGFPSHVVVDRSMRLDTALADRDIPNAVVCSTHHLLKFRLELVGHAWFRLELCRSLRGLYRRQRLRRNFLLALWR
mmetsp:Transcript_122326/g.391325  ORF Transcript_122326/g.391325 Transcript_122326/m.391325 type:complete len:205 (-) Transcript_122326:795-1409(-)